MTVIDFLKDQNGDLTDEAVDSLAQVVGLKEQQRAASEGGEVCFSSWIISFVSLKRYRI